MSAANLKSVAEHVVRRRNDKDTYSRAKCARN